MRKIISVIMILSILITSVFGVTSIASAESSQTKDIHLINPTAIAIYDSLLIVADNITDTNSVIHIFDISQQEATLKNTISLPIGIRSARQYEDNVYLISDGSYIQLNCKTFQTTTFTSPIEDIAIYKDAQYNINYTIVNGTVYRNNGNKSWKAQQLLTIGNTLYLLNNGIVTPYELNLSDGASENAGTSIATEYTNIFVANDTIGYYSANKIAVGNLTIDNLQDVVCAVASQNDVYVLNANNKITKWTVVDGKYSKVEGYEIGSDTVTLSVPNMENITKYTLAAAKGYPSNIIYKTTSSNSIDNLIETLNNSSYIVLGYQGDEECAYYYVMYNSRFGWVKKSDNITAVEEDPQIQVINTRLDDVAGYRAKLISPNAVYVYSAPMANSDKGEYLLHSFAQTAVNPTEVTLLQQFVSSDNALWYYVSYHYDNVVHYGFVLKGDVGKIYSYHNNNNIVLDKAHPRLKINAGLSDNVSMYLTSDLDETQLLVDGKTNQPIKLSSGTRVNCITYTERACYLQVLLDDNTAYYGWVDTALLINPDQLTTETILGVSLVVGALVVIGIITIIIRNRKNNLNNNEIELD